MNEYKLSASRTAAGKLFHTTGPATENLEKALSPSFVLVRGTEQLVLDAEGEMSPSRITVGRLHRICEVVWAAACVDCEHYQCRLELVQK